MDAYAWRVRCLGELTKEAILRMKPRTSPRIVLEGTLPHSASSLPPLLWKELGVRKNGKQLLQATMEERGLNRALDPGPQVAVTLEFTPLRGPPELQL